VRDARIERRVPVALAVIAALALEACTLGPRYVKPATAAPAAFAEANADAFNATQVPEVWRAFADPVLDQLIGAALARNRTLAQSVARLNEARALRGLETFALFPVVTASGSSEQSKPSGRDPFVPLGVGSTTVYRAGFDASWEIDLFGAARSARRVLNAEEAAAAASLRGARQAIVAEVAQAYFNLRGEQERLRVTRLNVDNLAASARLIEARRDAGRGSELDVARAATLAFSALARLPQTEAGVARQEQRLAVLTAQPIAELRAMLGAPTALPALPALVPIGSPADWLRRRPDVAEAERRLAAATARVGVDAAEFLPQLTLLGGFGWTAQERNELGDRVAERWNWGPSLSWSFLDVGRVRQRVRAANARAAGALAAYDDTVLRALEETENALAGYRAANRSADLLGRAASSSRTATGLARARFEAGASDLLVVLDAERTQLDLEDQLATAEAQRGTALAALYKALAGDFATAR
jgi:multidrug efflux system outer membrane protein